MHSPFRPPTGFTTPYGDVWTLPCVVLLKTQSAAHAGHQRYRKACQEPRTALGAFRKQVEKKNRHSAPHFRTQCHPTRENQVLRPGRVSFLNSGQGDPRPRLPPPPSTRSVLGSGTRGRRVAQIAQLESPPAHFPCPNVALHSGHWVWAWSAAGLEGGPMVDIPGRLQVNSNLQQNGSNEGDLLVASTWGLPDGG